MSRILIFEFCLQHLVLKCILLKFLKLEMSGLRRTFHIIYKRGYCSDGGREALSLFTCHSTLEFSLPTILLIDP